jgi:bifunctional non-homologous end joining protein LigD
MPEWMSPMLATLTDKRFSDPGWIFERKLDGERALAFVDNRRVRVLSRNRLEIGLQYPELVAALERQDVSSFVLDGEIVAFDGSQTSFARLQQRMHVNNPGPSLLRKLPVIYYVFDLLYLDGHHVTRLPLRRRKALLRAGLSFGPRVLRLSSHRNTEGEAYYEEACRKGWEGLIAKRADAAYVGTRSKDWLKFKCVNAQEFVIGGWTDPQGSRERFGALLIGYYEGDDLVYAGKVGTGFAGRVLEDLAARLARLERDEPPFTKGTLPRLRVHWVEPELVGQIGFSEWTKKGQLRHPRFEGLRDDKSPREVIRERPRA